MTAPDVVELGRRAVKAPGWTLDRGGHEPPFGAVSRRDSSGVRWVVDRSAIARGEWVPDLADHATLGAIEYGILAPLGVWIEGGFRGPWRARVREDRALLTEWHGVRVAAVVEALEAAPVRS